MSDPDVNVTLEPHVTRASVNEQTHVVTVQQQNSPLVVEETQPNKVTVVDDRNIRVVNVNETPRKLQHLADVDTSNLSDGGVLVYDTGTGRFVAAKELRNLTISGGNF